MNARDLECECLVIGSGPGGAVTAAVLAEAGRDVLVLEEGAEAEAGTVPYSLDEMKGLFRYGGLALAGGRPNISYMEGCCLGGASEINAGLYHRPPPQVLEQWAQEYGLRDFQAGVLDHFFEKNEQVLVTVHSPSMKGPTSRIIEQGARACGWKCIELTRLWDYTENISQGRRRSMSRSFIPQAKHSGARFMTRTRVEKICFRGRQAHEAICVLRQGRKGILRVGFKKVFVCAGAVQTPFLLRRSGLTRNIGDRLKMHLSARLVARFDTEASDPREGVTAMQVSEFKPRLTISGSFSSPAYLALWLAGRGDFAKLMQTPSNMAIFHAYFNIDSPARVRPALGTGEPRLIMDWQAQDSARIGDALYKMGHMLFAAGAKIIYSPVPGREDFYTIAQMGSLKDGAGCLGADLSTIHLFSSCPMGEDLSRCALDSYGRVHGTDNVYVNDASMLPDSPGTNPQAVIMALARRNACHILQ